MICQVPGEPSDSVGTTGELLVVSMTDRRLLRLTRGASSRGGRTGQRRAVAPQRHGRRRRRPRIRRQLRLGRRDRSGRIASTVLLRVDPDGAVAVAANDLVNPNGMAISPDGRTLFVNETFAARITGFDRATDGELTNRRTGPRSASGPSNHPGGARLGGAAPGRDGAGQLRRALGGRLPRDGGGPSCCGRQGVRARLAAGGHTAFAVALGGPLNRTLFLCTAPPLQTRVDHRRTREACMCSHLASTAGLGGLGRGRD